MSVSVKRLAASLAVTLLRLLRSVKRGLQTLLRGFVRLSAPVGRIVLRLFILPIYRTILFARFRMQRLALPARAAVMFLVTNRYLLHITLGIVSLVVIVTNLQGKQAHAQDVGQRSILFALATDQQSEIVEESVHTDTQGKNAKYLSSATVSGIPHVDFDYDASADPVQPSITVPGTIAAQPFDTSASETVPQRTGIITYTVQDGDTISSIAQHFGLNVGSLLWNNNLTERQYIRPGDTLTIPPVSGLIATVKKGDTLSKLAEKYNADAAEIASVNGLPEKGSLAVGANIVIPGATPSDLVQTQTQIAVQTPEEILPTPKPPKPPKQVAVAQPEQPTEEPPAVETPPPASSDSGSSDEQLTEPETPAAPVSKPPDANTDSAPKNKLFWPTSGHMITQYYGWQHTGVDIDGDYTSPLYAADDGVVEKAGWNSGGYGLQIIIDHPSGLKTRYAHSSKIFVKAGDHVKRGQVIAMMGTTGRSTGTHLHFEVYVGDKRTNPLGYIK